MRRMGYRTQDNTSNSSRTPSFGYPTDKPGARVKGGQFNFGCDQESRTNFPPIRKGPGGKALNTLMGGKKLT